MGQKFTKEEKEYLKEIIKKDIKRIKEEGETIIYHPFPGFLAGEKKLEQFFKELIKKLE